METPPGYSVVALCYGDPSDLEQQNWPFHMSQPSADDIDWEWAISEPWIWAWVLADLVSLLALPNLHHQCTI